MNKNPLVGSKHNPLLPLNTEITLPSELAARIDLYPENRRRPVNKTLFRNDYFQLCYNMKENSMAVSSRGDLVYSAIPYDTARNYIQRAAIQYLLHPEEARRYIESHKVNLETYLVESIFQVTKKRPAKNSFEVTQAYNAIFQNPLFEIQILGRLLQHDDTGALSANLAGKFLFSENVKTGIAGYVSEYLNFVIQCTSSLPITTDGKEIQLLDSNVQEGILSKQNMNTELAFDSDINQALDLLPQEVKQQIESSMAIAKQTIPTNNKMLLRSEYGKELSEVRNKYVAHSIQPKEIEHHFENVHKTENRNLVNVVSDVHALDGKLPFINENFNILVGDVSDSRVTNKSIEGIYVIGNHDLVDVLPTNDNLQNRQWDKWTPFFKNKWFEQLLENPDESWYLLPTGDHTYYDIVKVELEKRFPKITVLNNSSVIHNGIRYIGLTIPVVLVKRKQEQQKFILKWLNKLLNNDYDTPTVIVSHAPLFNELSMLSPKSKAYNKDYGCSEPKIEKLVEEYNIIGAIHGHHHIPASSGRYQIMKFAGKELFVVCSIYSKMNTGYELMNLLPFDSLNN